MGPSFAVASEKTAEVPEAEGQSTVSPHRSGSPSANRQLLAGSDATDASALQPCCEELHTRDSHEARKAELARVIQRCWRGHIGRRLAAATVSRANQSPSVHQRGIANVLNEGLAPATTPRSPREQRIVCRKPPCNRSPRNAIANIRVDHVTKSLMASESPHLTNSQVSWEAEQRWAHAQRDPQGHPNDLYAHGFNTLDARPEWWLHAAYGRTEFGLQDSPSNSVTLPDARDCRRNYCKLPSEISVSQESHTVPMQRLFQMRHDARQMLPPDRRVPLPGLESRELSWPDTLEREHRWQHTNAARYFEREW
eukprot:SAG31_NODE_4333_length_3345_cov_1.877388_2_plen_310_part_00